MKLFGFGRKKEEPEDSWLPEQESSEQGGQNEAGQEDGKLRKRGGKGSYSRSESSSAKVTANIERLAAKVEALSELRRTDAERFSRISEQIGELRNLILDKEAEIKEIGVKAVKAAETIEALQPENMLSEVRKSEAKYHVLEAKIEAANALYNRVMEEFKEVRKRLALFQGTEELLKLNEETGSNLANIKRIEANIESQASKTGNIYTQFQKQANELIRYHDAVAAMQEGFKKLEKTVNEVKLKAQSALIDQSDLNKLKAELSRQIEQAGIMPRADFQKKLSGQAAFATLKELRQELEKKEKEVQTLKSKIRAGKKNEDSNALAGFEVGIEELRRAISERNVNSAITLYNLTRDSYIQLTKSEMPEERKRPLRSQLLELYKALSGLVKGQGGQQE